jgi:ubiquinol-cytochrome c reductase cytochrome c subunit
VRRLLLALLVLGCAAVPASAAQAPPADPALVALGRSLFQEGCVTCHGQDARGTERGPNLHGVGARSADFYLRTGRMPLAVPGEEPLRNEPLYSEREIEALVAYVGSLGGPPIPEVDLEAGSVSRGKRAYALFCAGCHGILAKGGIVTGAIAPSLDEATPTQIAEAVRVGPFVMPAFDERVIDEETLNSIVRYVELTQEPDNRGGWALGSIGPIPEGMVAFFIGLAALLVIARIIAGRAE